MRNKGQTSQPEGGIYLGAWHPPQALSSSVFTSYFLMWPPHPETSNAIHIFLTLTFQQTDFFQTPDPIYSYFLDICTWMVHRHLHLNMSKTKLRISPSKLLLLLYCLSVNCPIIPIAPTRKLRGIPDAFLSLTCNHQALTPLPPSVSHSSPPFPLSMTIPKCTLPTHPTSFPTTVLSSPPICSLDSGSSNFYKIKFW